MSYDLQKASFLKRISAFILDGILMLIIITGVAYGFSLAFNFDKYSQEFVRIQKTYEEKYNVIMTPFKYPEDYDKYTEEQKKDYEQRLKESFNALNKDKDALAAYGSMIQLSLLITTFSILIGFLILEFIVPLILKNGQTVGKKVFSIGVMRIDGVRITPLVLFIRTILGKYTIETMIPVFILIMMLASMIGLLGWVILLGILILQIVLLATTEYRSAIHDTLAKTVTIDLSSQLIFNTKEEMIEYKQRRQDEKAAEGKY